MDTLVSDSNIYSTKNASECVTNSLQSINDFCVQQNIKLYICTEVPIQTKTPSQRMLLHKLFNAGLTRGVHESHHQKHQTNFNTVIKNSKIPDSSIVHLSSFCFDLENNSIVGENTTSYYFDDDHLNQNGVDTLLEEPLKLIFRKMNNSSNLNMP